MDVLKFETRVSEDGTIKLPASSELENLEVEVIITAKTRKEKGSARKIAESWVGIISGSNGNVEEARMDYLNKKYLK
jgi:hypothetical protein